LVSKSEQAMDSFQLAMNNINSLVGDEQMRRDLQASISTVPLLLEETRVAVNKYSAVADRADQSLKDAEGFTKSLGDLGNSSQQMAENIDEITGKLDRLVLDLLTMSDAINKQEGTLGQLVYNPELYQRLNRAAGNVEQISYRLRPIVEDVRVFSDKIARDPGRLGLKGALERNQTGGKFFPFGNMRRSTPQLSDDHYCAPPVDVHYEYEVQPQIHLQPPQPMPGVQPAGHQAAVPQWSPTRPASTTPQQFWQSQ
jgi:phospholipid/cholesterol/gamma-HCH transport system substrate-binding protein